MKARNHILSIFLVIISFVSSPFVRAQEIIRTVDNDTLITITPAQLSTINCAFSDLKLTELQVEKQKELIENLEERICYDDSIYTHMENVMSIRNDKFALELEKVKSETKKDIKQKSILWAIIGTFIGLFIGSQVAK